MLCLSSPFLQTHCMNTATSTVKDSTCPHHKLFTLLLFQTKPQNTKQNCQVITLLDFNNSQRRFWTLKVRGSEWGTGELRGGGGVGTSGDWSGGKSRATAGQVGVAGSEMTRELVNMHMQAQHEWSEDINGLWQSRFLCWWSCISENNMLWKIQSKFTPCRKSTHETNVVNNACTIPEHCKCNLNGMQWFVMLSMIVCLWFGTMTKFC